ncbi:MAG: class I SAM-dependent methyltransferase [Gammaproteobacteria bacterium]|nr:class I SAM-dependent methyltransferase [Gammaproteobacteria bacterium]NNL99703.1 class I SAM-dependent methyltransferase [Gammaproteobacteria bacterium]
MTTDSHDIAREIERGERFEFGANWRRFLDGLDAAKISQAENSLTGWLGDDIADKRFLDIGSGSGLLSLAAVNLGARVHSFDYDPASVACTRLLKERYHPEDAAWRVEQGSALDDGFLAGLEQADIVYSWGVLHHTGDMYSALANAADLVRPGGRIFIAIYNDQGWISRYWHGVKRLYNRGGVLRWMMIIAHSPYLLGGRWLARLLSGRRALERGMSLWHDMLDWLGGYPFETASPSGIIEFFTRRGFELARLKDCGTRMGCNEYLFVRHRAADAVEV